MKAALLGTVPSSRRVAPYEDDSWEIWVCSPGNSQQAAPPRITRWFELHAIVDCLGVENRMWWPAYVDWLNKQTFPIYMQERNEHVPAAIPFPRDRLLARWGMNSDPSKGPIRTNWFTSSLTWMMALAMWEMTAKNPRDDEDVIGIFGVDMAANEELITMQKSGIHRFIEFAHDLGIKVQIPLESSLSTPAPLYGYVEASRMGRALIVREMEYKERIQQLDQQRHQAEMQAAFFRGGLEQVIHDRRTYCSGHDDAEVDFSEEGAAADADRMAEKAAEIAGDTMQLRDGLLVPKNPSTRETLPTASDFPGLGATPVSAPKAGAISAPPPQTRTSDAPKGDTGPNPKLNGPAERLAQFRGALEAAVDQTDEMLGG